VVKSLLERDLVRIVGRRDAPGRPALYGTSASFLETFGLRSLSDLPALREIEAIVAAPAEELPADESALDVEPPSEAGTDPDGEPEDALAEPPAAALQLH